MRYTKILFFCLFMTSSVLLPADNSSYWARVSSYASTLLNKMNENRLLTSLLLGSTALGITYYAKPHFFCMQPIIF